MSYLEENGFDVTVVHEDDMAAFRAQHGVPEALRSCHTAIIGGSGLVIEGHIPIQAIDVMMAARLSLDMDGIALPGMPPGSPGMPGTPTGKLDILMLRDGLAAPFMTMAAIAPP